MVKILWSEIFVLLEKGRIQNLKLQGPLFLVYFEYK